MMKKDNKQIERHSIKINNNGNTLKIKYQFRKIIKHKKRINFL